MSIILWLVMGAVVGWVASILMGTNAQQGTILNIIVGIVGAALGGYVSTLFGGSGMSINNSFSLLSFGVLVCGAVLLIAIVRAFRR